MPDLHIQFLQSKLTLCGLNEKKPPKRFIFVSVVEQKLWAYEGEKLFAEFACSTSAKPPSCQYGSNGTPLGLHKIAQKIGDGQPLGMIFEKREPTGKIAEGGDEKAYVTSRILWLEGLEENKNEGYECGTHNRKIYIHGTNHEDKIGTPKSHGCVELKNADVIKLYDWARAGDFVLID